MSEYILSCCSTVDLSADYMGERNIHYLPFHFELDEVLYADDFGKSIPLKEFYRKMKDGAMPRTSQINVTEYEEYFEAFLKDGKDILHITASSGLSGTYNSAMIAARDLQESIRTENSILSIHLRLAPGADLSWISWLISATKVRALRK